MHKSPQPASSQQVSWREKISYGLGDTGFNFYWSGISTFLLFFYTDVFGITAAAAGFMMTTIKLINAFTDPLIGALADRTSTRHGKFRPYLVWMAAPLTVSAVLVYTTPNIGGDGKLIWAYVTYLLMMVCYTSINIPYNALSGVMSSDPQQRVDINTLRFVSGFTGGTLVGAATLKLVEILGQGNPQVGWQLTMVFWGLAASVLFVNTFFNTKERVQAVNDAPSKVWVDIKDLKGNRPWMILFVLALIIMVTITLRQATAVYYFKYYVGRTDLIAAFVPAYMFSAAAGAALTPILTRLIDKRNLMIILMTLTGIFSVAFYFVPKDQVEVMFGLQIAIGLVLGPKSPLAFSMYADTADYNEWRTGRRATAMTFAAATFSQKLGTALATALIGSVFTALGYVANADQSQASLDGIVLLMSIFPAIFAFIAAFVLLFYTLDKQQLKTIQEELTQRKAAKQAASGPILY
ncbi:MAG: MFS transporter [Marinagarivorans sp.]